MNVLILTPDAVGSTLLQRLLTIYMQFQTFDKPVINLHELTNGLESYYSDVFNQMVLGKPQKRSYHQSLPEIQNLLNDTKHYKTSRLAKYHIDRRNDSIAHQSDFYEYLNQNFFIIATRRKNVLEHAISWCVNTVTKKLNVYHPGEKISTFIDLYQNPIHISPEALVQHLNQYQKYVVWSEQFFKISSVFCYEDHLPTIERYILNLPVFAGQTQIGWKEKFDISFNDWNMLHHLTSDLESLAVNQPEALKFFTTQQHSNSVDLLDFQDDKIICNQYNQVKDPSWPTINSYSEFNNLSTWIKDECVNVHQLTAINWNSAQLALSTFTSSSDAEFIKSNKTQYKDASGAIDRMQELGILVTGIPIKKQTLAGKKAMVKNWNECIEVYNKWTEQWPDLGQPMTTDSVDQQIKLEQHLWHTGPNDLTKFLT